MQPIPFCMNMRGGLLYLCFFIISFSAFAQHRQGQKTYAQFKKETKNLKEDTNKVLRYLEFAKTLEPPDSAMAVIDAAGPLANKLNYQKGINLINYLKPQKIYAQFKRESKYLKEDTNKALFYVSAADSLLGAPQFRDTARIIEIKAKELAYKLNYLRGIELSIRSEGFHAEANMNLPVALRYYREAVKMAESHKSYLDIHGKYPEIYALYNSCLNIYYYQADYPNAMDVSQKGLSVAGQLNDKEGQAHYIDQIGFIYQKQDKADESIKYYTQYLMLANEIHNRMMVADACNGIADDYLLKRAYNTSIAYFFKALNIYEKMHDGERLDGQRLVYKPDRIAYTLFKISDAYKQAGNYKQALHYSLAVVNIINSVIYVSNPYDVAGYYINTGDIYQSLKDYKQAAFYLNKGLSLARSIRHREDIRDAYDALAKTYAGQHKYDSAYIYSTLHTQLKDSIINEESSTKIAGIQARYDAERKDREMAARNLIRNIFIIALGLLVITLFLLYSRYLLKQKNKYQSQVNKQQTVLFNAVVSAQDNERKRIAQDIHDSLGSVLSAAKLNLSGLEDDKSRFTNAQKEKYETALGLLDDASSELRNISHNLMPATLLKLGLIAALQNLFDKISVTGVHINFTAHEVKDRLEEAIEISIYRIILELVNNVVKHAGATDVTVQLIKYPSYINITVEDNGRGFIYDQTAAGTKGMGLNSISSRVEYLKGTMDIDLGKGTGTTVMIDIPLDGNTNIMV